MGFSKSSGEGAASAPSNASQTSGGSKFLEALMKSYPIAGTAMESIFGGAGNQGPTIHQQNTVPQPSQVMPGDQPLPPVPDIIGMNAKPKDGGGLSMILKLLSGL